MYGELDLLDEGLGGNVSSDGAGGKRLTCMVPAVTLVRVAIGNFRDVFMTVIYHFLRSFWSVIYGNLR
jgi:hypothetical protein